MNFFSETAFSDPTFCYDQVGREGGGEGGDPNGPQLFGDVWGQLGPIGNEPSEYPWSTVNFFLRNGIFRPNFLL